MKKLLVGLLFGFVFVLSILLISDKLAQAGSQSLSENPRRGNGGLGNGTRLITSSGDRNPYNMGKDIKKNLEKRIKLVNFTSSGHNATAQRNCEAAVNKYFKGQEQNYRNYEKQGLITKSQLDTILAALKIQKENALKDCKKL